MTANSKLSSLTIGALDLSPTFDADVTEYAVTTSNNSNKVTAVAADENATIEISKGVVDVENGSQVTWDEGENVITVKVTNGDASTTYTVTVTK